MLNLLFTYLNFLKMTKKIKPADNTANQKNANSEAFKKVKDNRSNQLNSNNKKTKTKN